MYGQKKYKDLADAVKNKAAYYGIYNVPEKLKETSFFIGYILIQADTTDITDTDFAIVESANGSATAGSGGVVTTLGGLDDVTIATPADNEVLVYNSTLSTWENRTPAGAFAVNQVAHGLSVLSPTRIVGSTWSAGKADTTANLPDALVVSVQDADNFTVATAGIQTVTGHGKTVGADYYTSNTSSGTTTTTIPTSGYAHLAYTVFNANTISIGPMIATEI